MPDQFPTQRKNSSAILLLLKRQSIAKWNASRDLANSKPRLLHSEMHSFYAAGVHAYANEYGPRFRSSCPRTLPFLRPPPWRLPRHAFFADPNLFLNYNWKVHDDTSGSDHSPILFENSTDELSKRTSSWNLEKANWDEFKTSCLTQLTPEANKNNVEDIAEERIPKSSTSTKYNRPWLNEECQKAVRLHRATFKKIKINPTRENLNT